MVFVIKIQINCFFHLCLLQSGARVKNTISFISFLMCQLLCTFKNVYISNALIVFDIFTNHNDAIFSWMWCCCEQCVWILIYISTSILMAGNFDRRIRMWIWKLNFNIQKKRRRKNVLQMNTANSKF